MKSITALSSKTVASKLLSSKTVASKLLSSKTVASKLLLMLAIVLLGFSCAPATTPDPTQTIEPTASGPPRNLSLDAVQLSSIVLAWQAPVYTGTKTGGIQLQKNELAYQVYYVRGNASNDPSTAEEVKNLAMSMSPEQKEGTAQGVTNLQIENLEQGSRYFLAVETYNSFAAAGTLSEEMIEIVMPIRFSGDLAYTETEYELMVHDSATTIVPARKPTTTTSEASVVYVLERTEGDLSIEGAGETTETTPPDAVISVDGGTGEVMINPTATGTAKFVVRAEATGYFSQEVSFELRIIPRVAGAVTGLTIPIASIENRSFEVQWAAPVETGTRQDGTKLKTEDLVYRVYYISGNDGDMLPEVDILAQDARTRSQIEEVQGSTNIRLFDLSSGTHYFVAVETYNPFTEVGTLSENVVEATTSTEVADLSGMLAYGQAEYLYPVNSPSVTITPSDTPTVTGASISYGLYKKGGVQFADSIVRIDVMTGEVTVDPSTAMIAGAVNYRVFAQVPGFNTQYAEITIRITQIGVTVTPYYSQDAGAVIPVPIGQAIVDDGTFSLADDEMVLSIESSEYSSDPGSEYTVHIDTGSGIGSSRGARFTKNPDAGNRIVIQKSELGDSNLSRANGAVIGLSGPGIAGIREVAIYRPREIRSWQDLQAMRIDLYGNYVLKSDIQFPDTAEGTSNFEPVGTWNDLQSPSYLRYTPFRGTLDGTNGTGSFRIIGLQIIRTEGYTGTLEYSSPAQQIGLFGGVEGGRKDRVIVKNLILVGCTVVGQDRIGTLAGAFLEGTIENVGVELSASGAGKVEGIVGDLSGRSIGGLVGFSSQSRVEGYSEVPVIGNEGVGGLVGNNNTDSVVSGYSSGDVTGTKHVGGLAGSDVSAASPSIIGYSSGNVTGEESVGGLVGITWASGGTKGYSTGAVTGAVFVGGLVGNAQRGTNVTGYAIGDVTGTKSVGGMVGIVFSGILDIRGYSRSTVYRSEGDDVYFGGAIGRTYTTSDIIENLTKRTYRSQGNPPEGQLLNMDGTEIEGAEGEHGNPVNIGEINDITLFSELFNPESSREWIWLESGRWPALDLGNIISAADQPIY